MSSKQSIRKQTPPCTGCDFAVPLVIHRHFTQNSMTLILTFPLSPRNITKTLESFNNELMNFSYKNIICKDIKKISNIVISHQFPTGTHLFLQLRLVKRASHHFQRGKAKWIADQQNISKSISNQL